jgi:hypothetical protein
MPLPMFRQRHFFVSTPTLFSPGHFDAEKFSNLTVTRLSNPTDIVASETPSSGGLRDVIHEI